MSKMIPYEDEINKYQVLRDNINSIVRELAFAIENISDIDAEIKSKYQVDDNYTPISLRITKLKTNLGIVYNNLKNKVSPAIDFAVVGLNDEMGRLEESKEQNNEQDTMWSD